MPDAAHPRPDAERDDGSASPPSRSSEGRLTARLTLGAYSTVTPQHHMPFSNGRKGRADPACRPGLPGRWVGPRGVLARASPRPPSADTPSTMRKHLQHTALATYARARVRLVGEQGGEALLSTQGDRGWGGRWCVPTRPAPVPRRARRRAWGRGSGPYQSSRARWPDSSRPGSSPRRRALDGWASASDRPLSELAKDYRGSADWSLQQATLVAFAERLRR